MAEARIRLDLSFSRANARRLMTFAMLVLGAGDLNSESFTLKTYFPAPSGLYRSLVTTNDAVLARTASLVTIGNNPTFPGNKLLVRGWMTARKLNSGGYAPLAANINAGSIEIGGPVATAGGGQNTIYFHHHGAIAHQLRYNGGTLYLERTTAYGSSGSPAMSVGGTSTAGDSYIAAKNNCRMVSYGEGTVSCTPGTEYATYTSGLMSKWTTSNGGDDPNGTMLCCPCPVGGCPGL